ncbi:MAG: hypothetical protein Q9O74_00305 [Planctomycetota bacterium]|nr:hypothetical protein [Planctomycetota bacterium]
MEQEHNETGKNNGTPHLLAFVAECPAACPVCDYSLRGLTTPICPECGAELELHVGSPRLRIGPWALAIVGFALALGFDGVVALIMAARLIANPATQWQPYGIVTGFTLLTTVMLGGLIFIARTRPAWTRRSVPTQRVLAGITFGSVGLLHVIAGIAFFQLVN